MATNRAMLKEAIADAKAVKETAIANAKAALEEAFTPQLKSMLSMKLQEMNDLEEDDLEETYMSEKKDEDLKETYDENDTMEEVDLEELLAELEEDEMEEGLYEAEETEEEDMEMSDEETEETEDEAEPIDLEDMTDEDLKTMIEDVIADMIKSGELEGGNTEEESEEVEDEEVENEEDVDLAELLREIENLEEESEDEDLKEESETKNLEEEDPISKEDSKIEMAFSKIDEGMLNEDPFPSPAEWVPIIGAIAGLLSSGYALNTLRAYIDKKAAEGNKKFEKIKNVWSKIGGIGKDAYGGSKGIKETEKSTEELEEVYSTIETLKSELNEINLLNAKLLYTNKIFKSKTLNESQKVKVLSSFDKAKNVGEVKMVFETLNEGIKVSKNTINENLGRASKGTIAPNVKKPIVESNEAFLRMQKLAGII